MSIINHIEYLLQSHDCVIVPDLGALLAHNVPAYFDEREQCWFPPARVISFNPELRRTDGLLAQSIARRDNTSMNVAAAIVRQECEKLHSELESNHFLSLGDAGSLSKKADGQMIFTPGDVAWLSPQTMWLPSLSLKQAHKEESSVGRRIALEAQRRRRSQRIRRAVSAAACFLVILTLGWIIGGNISNLPSIQFASVAPVGNIDEPQNPEGIFVGEISDKPADVILAQDPRPAEVISDDIGGRYVLIVGSLSTEEEARRFINQYKDIKLQLLTVDGRFRVYAAASDSWEETAAAAKRPEIASKFESTWVCVRK